jgi:internalin A
VGGDESQGAKEMRQLWVVTMQKRAAQLDLSGQLMESLPQSVSHLRALRRLVLDDNLLRALPEDMGCLPSLRELSCDNNRLTEVPPVLAAGNVCNLVLLSLGNNLISEVPSWASRLVGLKTLNLQVSHPAPWHTRDSQAYD